MAMKVTDRYLDTHSDHPLASLVRQQRARISELEQSLEMAERRERDAAREIERLKREIAALKSR
jgi:polyhydroxyalkanoate synthesis regulator phasin